QRVMIAPGEFETHPPPQPNLSMARRTPESLLRQVEQWHGALRLIRANDQRFWRASGVRPFAARTGPRDRPEEQTHWRVREILSAQELVEEGRRMRHCVATYAGSCIRGACSIWSLERQRGHENHPEAMLTVEIDANKTIVQARGHRNRLPTEQERSVLEAWMRDAGLKSGPYLYVR